MSDESEALPVVEVAADPAPEVPATPETFEQRVERQLLVLTKAISNLPQAIAQANNHPEPESWRQKVLDYLKSL